MRPRCAGLSALVVALGREGAGSVQDEDAGVGVLLLLPLAVLAGMGPSVAWIAFLVASSVTHGALRALARARAL